MLGLASYKREMRCRRGFFMDAVVSSIWSSKPAGAVVCSAVAWDAIGPPFTGVAPDTLLRALRSHSALPRAGAAAAG